VTELKNKIDLILGKALVLIMGLMVVNVLWQVFTRFIIGDPSSFTDELARFLMIWLGVLGAAFVSGKNLHVAIDIIPSRSSSARRRRMNITVDILIILFALAAFVIGGSRLVYISYVLGQQSPALQFPMALIYSVIPLSGLLIVFFKTHKLMNE
jgi:TRAP-type C4-dicarboxylate transport system permease small subunit